MVARIGRIPPGLAVLLLATAAPAPAPAQTRVETVISREAPQFNAANADLVAGRDGRVYLSCPGSGSGYVLSMAPDGSAKLGLLVGHAEGVTAVNVQGTRAHRLGHFAHTAAFIAADGTRLGANTEFDNTNYDGPQTIGVGPSGDFYALDRFAKRVVRLDAAGRPVKVYTIPDGNAFSLRVCEPKGFLLVDYWAAPKQAIGFDGTVRGTVQPPGPFDVDEDGVVYSIAHRNSDALVLLGIDGKPVGNVKLDLGTRLPKDAEESFTALQVMGDEVLLKRNHPYELFARYDRKTGAFKGAVLTEHERLAVTLNADLLTAGQPVGLTIEFDPGARRTLPAWRVWARPFGAPGWRELAWRGGQLQVPADYAGLYQLKVSDELQPWARGAGSDYLAQTLVEVRAPESKGTASVMTPQGRVCYGRGEHLQATVLIRAAQSSDVPRTVTLQLREGGAATAPGRIVWEHAQPAQAAAPAIAPAGSAPAVGSAVSVELAAELPRELTASLSPGAYSLMAVATGLTSVAQHLVIGPGARAQPFWRMLHGDMGNFSIGESTPLQAPDQVSGWVETMDRLGFNAIVERLGSHLHRGWFDNRRFDAAMAPWQARLEKDPLATSPRKLTQPPPLLQCLGGYSALGVEALPIFLGNDAGSPAGTGFDARKDEEFTADITRATQAMAPYAAFRGWDWAANWWMFSGLPVVVGADKPAFDAAWKRTDETGAWDPVIDTVYNRLLAQNDESIRRLTGMLEKAIEPGRCRTAVAAPYRRVEWYPPMNFAHVDEVDLHYQCEQVPAPFYMLHEVDYYRRPGKRAWGHPEIYNESGTGEQTLGANLMMLMRGPDGAGVQSGLPPMFQQPLNAADSRVSTRGGPTIVRSLNELLASYGPWLTRTEKADPVAIVASSRMLKTDAWASWTGRHFGRLANAYMACLANHTPASIVFTEDLIPGALAAYKAVLIVDQRFELEPPLAAALAEARAAGVRVFADDTCRAELVKDCTPLGVGFTQFDDGFGANHQDIAYRLMPQLLAATQAALAQHLGFLRAEQPDTASPQVYLSTRRSGGAAFVWVANNTMIPLDYGQLWRATLFSSTRLPVIADVVLPPDLAGRALYDLFALKRIEARDGRVKADLRALPLRVIAALPAAIGQVELRAPQQVQAGSALRYNVRVLDASGQPLDCTLPVRVHLLAGNTTWEDVQLAVPQAGLEGTLPVPVNAPAGELTLRAVELVSGMGARVGVQVTPADAPVAGEPKLRTVTDSATGLLPPIEQRFGPHLRDAALSADGSTVMFNAMNWDDNVYALRLADGTVRFQGKVGAYFAFAPVATRRGFLVQGFDFDACEGYHLYQLDAAGKSQRRFALYGIANRLPHRFVPHLVRDRLNNFAAAPDGSWIATSGDLGLAVWSAAGKLLWSEDTWRDGRREPMVLAALDKRTLLAARGMTLRAIPATAGGKPRWEQTLGSTDDIRALQVSRDGATVAALTSFQGGRVTVLRGGKIEQSVPCPGVSEFALSADGARLALAQDRRLSVLSLVDGARWSFNADSALRLPRFSPDGKRLAVASELGSVYVLGADAAMLYSHDVHAVAVPVWLADGDLVLGDWMGNVVRLDAGYKPRWQVRLTPTEGDTAASLAVPAMPTHSMDGWGNALTAPLVTPNTLTQQDNLLVPRTNRTWSFAIRLMTSGRQAELTRKVDELFDGQAAAPVDGLIPWPTVETFAEQSPENWLEFDAGIRLVRLDAITFFEDAARPESWLRDVKFERWDFGASRWMPVAPLLSNAAIHSHALPGGVEGTRFRLVLAGGFPGNIRLGELFFHGQDLGSSHPDVRAGRPVAVLFDDNILDLRGPYEHGHNPGFKLVSASDACSGSSYISFTPGPNKPEAGPHSLVAHWSFAIREQPQGGEYRYLQFATKALSPQTTRVTLTVVGAKPIVVEKPSEQWATTRVDLLPLLGGKPATITSINFGAEGGPAAFDQVLLGRTLKDLEAVGP